MSLSGQQEAKGKKGKQWKASKGFRKHALKDGEGEVFCSDMAMHKYIHNLKRVDILPALPLSLPWPGSSDGLYLLSLVLLPMGMPVMERQVSGILSLSLPSL